MGDKGWDTQNLVNGFEHPDTPDHITQPILLPGIILDSKTVLITQ